jgi:ATP-dependent 26S proteasome regulatory subunit
VYQAALHHKPICIILDAVDAIWSPSTVAASYDAASPVVQSLMALIQSWTRAVQASSTENTEEDYYRHQCLPFPHHNKLYQCGTTGGRVLPVQLLWVAVVTCPDDGGKTTQSQGRSTVSSFVSLFDHWAEGKYRLPDLTPTTRVFALKAAIERAGVHLTNEANEYLSYLVATAQGLHGSGFERVASLLPKIATVQDLHDAVLQVTENQSGHGSFVTLETIQNQSGGASRSNDRQNEFVFENVGGNTQAKTALLEALSLNDRRQRLLKSVGLSPPTGLLLYGAPGTGKTMLARGVARLLSRPLGGRSGSCSTMEIGGSFVSIRSNDIVQAQVGSGEQALISAFTLARQNAPSVVFMDEFQSLFLDRSGTGASTGRPLTSTLLSLMDDLHRWDKATQQFIDQTTNTPKKNERVVVLAATNTPWMIDKAFLRPGRFDQVVHVKLPDVEERQSIFSVLVSNMKTSLTTSEEQTTFCTYLATVTDGYSGADISTVCRTAAVACMLADDGLVNEHHFRLALEQIKPSSDSRLVNRISRWEN